MKNKSFFCKKKVSVEKKFLVTKKKFWFNSCLVKTGEKVFGKKVVGKIFLIFFYNIFCE